MSPRRDGRRKSFSSLWVDLDRLAGVVAVVYDSHGPVTIKEIRMASIDIAGLHGDQILHQLIRRLHSLLEKANYNAMEFLLERWVSSEHLLCKELRENADELIVD